MDILYKYFLYFSYINIFQSYITGWPLYNYVSQ